MLLHFSLLEKRGHKRRRVNLDLLSKLVEAILDLVLALDSFLLHFLFDLLEFFFLLLLKLLLLLRVLFFCGAGELQFKLLLNFLIGLIFSFSMILLELGDFIFFLLLEFFELLPGLVNDLLHHWVDHHLLHLEAHLRLEAQTELALGLADGHLVVFDGGGCLARARASLHLARFVQKLHDLRLIGELHCQVVMGV